MSECTIIHRKRRVAVIHENQSEPQPVRKTDHHELSLHPERPAAGAVATEAPAEKNRHARKEKQRRAKVRRRAARLQLLHDHWPELFAVTRPLQVGIRNALALDAQQRGLEVSANDIGLGLREWVRRRVYLKALVYGDGRYDIRGEQAEPLSEEHRQISRETLARLDEAWQKANFANLLALPYRTAQGLHE